jgi:hypothetical protein
MSGKRKSKEAGSKLQCRRLVYLLGETAERILRLQRILERQRIYAEVEHRKFEYRGPINTLAGAINDFKQRLTSNSARIAALLRDASLPARDLKTLLSTVHRVLHGIHGIHELFVLLPREAAEPQVFFMLRDCFKWQKQNPEAAVILTNLIGSYEYRMEDVLRGISMSQNELSDLRHILKDFAPGGNVVGIAFVDRDNPLAWTVLAHEYGHVLDDAQRIASRIVHGDQVPSPDKEKKERTKVSWIAEMFCDFVAAHVLGAASMVQILFVEMMRPHLSTIGKEAPGHPPTPVRLRLVCDYLLKIGVSTADFDDFFRVYEFDYAEKLDRMTNQDQTAISAMCKLAEETLSPVADAVAANVGLQVLRPFNNERAQNAKRLARSLPTGVPISSMRKTSEKRIRGKLKLLGKGSSRDDVYAALGLLNEVPTNSAEILYAGWLYKLATFQKKLQESFERQRGQPEVDLKEYDDYLAKTDGLLLKSLELAAVQIEMEDSSGGA